MRTLLSAALTGPSLCARAPRVRGWAFALCLLATPAFACGPATGGDPVAMLRTGTTRCGPRPETAGMRIPLQPGLVLTTVSTTQKGDEEADKRIVAASPGLLTVRYRAERDDGVVEATRHVRRQDLIDARSYRHAFTGDTEPSYPGTTALGVSSQVLRDLKTGGSSELTLDVGGLDMQAGIEGADLVGELEGMLGDLGGFAGIEEAIQRQADIGTLTETERAQGADTIADIRRLGLATGRLRNTGPLQVEVIVNNRPRKLAGIGASGSLSDGERDHAVSAVFLDDDSNPLTLRLEIDGERMQLVRVAYAQESPIYAAQIEDALLERCRADVYGIGFSRDGMRIAPGAEDALAALRRVFAKHADWHVEIAQYGDGSGATGFAPSQAQRVRDALAADGSAALAVAQQGDAPAAADDSASARARARRTTFVRQGCTP